MKKTFMVYCMAYIALLTLVLGLLYAYPKPELHLLLNAHHTRLQDIFFKYYSMMAEGPLYALALIPLFLKAARLTVFFALSEALGGGLLQILKHTICMPRPASVFDNLPDMTLPLVEGISLHHGNSFPSGHASTFFVFFTCCALLLVYYRPHKPIRNKRRLCLLVEAGLLMCLAMAALGAYSRVYLSQHFLSDICMGSVIGFATPCILFYFGRQKLLKIKPDEATS
jgi:membrane-associated phospholipid phosphatase